MTKSKTPCPYCGKKEWRSFASVCFLVELDSYSDLESFSNDRALEYMADEWVELKSGLMAIVDWPADLFVEFENHNVVTVDECCHCGTFVQG